MTSCLKLQVSYQNYDKTCKKSRKICTSCAALVSIVLCVYNTMRELASCSQSQPTVQSMVSAHWVVSADCSRNVTLRQASRTWRRPFPCNFYFSCDVYVSARLRENRWTDLHEIFRIFKERVEWPRDDLIKFRVNSGTWVGASKVKLLSSDSYLVWLLSSDSRVLPSSDWECNGIAVFLAFCYIVTRGRGLLCFSPQLVSVCIN